jgi:hypothetical protein
MNKIERSGRGGGAHYLENTFDPLSFPPFSLLPVSYHIKTAAFSSFSPAIAAAAAAVHRSAVEGQLAPDGQSVRKYAEAFNSTLSNFVKKCVVNS